MGSVRKSSPGSWPRMKRLTLPGLSWLGDRRVLDYGMECAEVDFAYQTIRTFAEAKQQPDVRLLLDRPKPEISLDPLGRVSKAAGHEVLDTLEYLLEYAEEGRIDGIVYAPLNKQSMQMTGRVKADELSFIVDLLSFDGHAGELNILNDFWTSRVTSHIPIKAVAEHITKVRVLAAIELVHRSLLNAGYADPKIAVSGLNPHAGDGGAFGDEEIKAIEPAVRAAGLRGIDVHGPFSPDTIFLQAQADGYHAIVSMYHDQGQIAMKLMGFGEGVTLLGGLPFPIATPAHGTAFDIAGKGQANAAGLKAAMQICITASQSRRRAIPTSRGGPWSRVN